MKIAAFDIGGTALKMGVVLPHGEIILTKSAEISGSDGDQILAEMKLFLAENNCSQRTGLRESENRAYHNGRRYS
ncbi:Beta-glucoside kinase [Listeria monocytogenes]|nr:Beta-glucoside kinase [Listeria monocytogenes]